MALKSLSDIGINRLMCDQEDEQPLSKLIKAQEIAPCKIHNGWVRRDWCYFKCPFFKGLLELETGEFFSSTEIEDVVKERERLRIQKVAAEQLRERGKRFPSFVKW